MSTPSLTETLLADARIADLYRRATQSQFLKLGGQGRLPRANLSKWLSQDRLYAQAYIRFIGGLISCVEFPVRGETGATDATLQWRVLNLLQTCLTGIMRELSFFEETASRYGLSLSSASPSQHEFGPNTTTKSYIELFDSFAVRHPGGKQKQTASRTLLGGLVVLWATEQAYLTAWSYAKQQTPSNADFKKDLDGGALRGEFIPNWTSQSFHDFVEDIRRCLDMYAESLTEEDENETKLETATSLVLEVLVLEEGFWPAMDVDEGD